MDLHFEGNRLYYLEKEAELFKCLTYLSQELGNQEPMTQDQLWEVFHICSDTAAVYRHITDYFNTLDKLILDARIENGKLKQELYDLKKQNIKMQEALDSCMNGL
jgi:uncharacterized protein YdcH (DUF465 family)